MLMRHLLTTISHGLMIEKCLTALNVFLIKNVTSIYQTIWLTTILWTWKTLRNNMTQMMLCCNMQLNMQTNIRANTLAQLMISYAMLSQEILQTIGKLHYQKAYCNQQLSGSIKWLVTQTERDYSCKSQVGITTEIFTCLLTNFIANTVKETSSVAQTMADYQVTFSTIQRMCCWLDRNMDNPSS